MLLDSLLPAVKEHGFGKFELSIAEENSASVNLFRSFSDRNNLTMLEKSRCAFGNITEIIYEISLT